MVDHKVILDVFGPRGWRLAQFARMIVWRILRPKRLAVAAIVFNKAGEVLLVENSYGPGWRLPGGGVEYGETATESLARELQEEVQLIPKDFQLHGVCLQEMFGASVQVLAYVVRQFEGEAKADGSEILRVLWAHPANLPTETERGAASRIAEVIAGASCAPRWSGK